MWLIQAEHEREMLENNVDFDVRRYGECMTLTSPVHEFNTLLSRVTRASSRKMDLVSRI